MDREKLVRGVLNAALTNNIEEGMKLLDPHAVMMMDGHRFIGAQAWAHWVQYLHLQNIKVIDFEIYQFTHISPDHIQLTGQVTIENASKEVRSNDFDLEYIFQGDKVIEAKTGRNNYTAILGDSWNGLSWAIHHGLMIWYYKKRGKIKTPS